LIWVILASLYFFPVWLVGFYADRHLSLAGSWRLAGAALMPGALVMVGAIFAYGLGVLNLLEMIAIFAAHIAVGWAYLILGPLSLPRTPNLPPSTVNPFCRGP
jgi:hypothetical protein